ncbi:MAG: serine protease [Candidatus Methanoplasma sp.]|nr:serine protease [Candidatus Methanoplasma sp.]
MSAFEKASNFTRPLVVSTRHVDGTVRTSCGSFIVINDEGWVMTAGHMFDSFAAFQTDQKKIREVRELNASRDSVQGAPGNASRMDPGWITNHSFWWSWDEAKLANAYVNRQIDLCVGRLEPFNPKWVREYPVFRDPNSLRIGTSVCRLGFPFAGVESSFDDSLGVFRLNRAALPIPFFPNDGIHSKTTNRGQSADRGIDMLYVETSTPGLTGQSGGPIVDRDGKVYAMQVQTSHAPLGFQPSVEIDGKRVVENQFINIGIGVHTKTIVDVLRSQNVRFRMDSDELGFRILD